MRTTKRQVTFESIIATPLEVRLEVAASLVTDPRPSLRALLLPVLEHAVAELRGAAPLTDQDRQQAEEASHRA
jgi:surface antigen